MDTTTETLSFRVVETVEYVHEIPLTDELLGEATALGYDNDAAGVLDMLAADPDHDAVMDAVVDTNFNGCTDRSVEEF